jgi:TonB family protein
MESISPTATSSSFAEASDLSKLCLPQEYKDTNRRLAWANSICVLFLLIGLVGLKPPKIHVRVLAEAPEPVPVEIIQPEDQPPTKPPEENVESEPTNEVLPDQPVVATVVAADPASAAFAVPVEGPVVLAPARLAAPPPVAPPKPQGDATKYVPSVGDWGGHPAPEYPGLAQRMGYQGTVTLQITVDPSGVLTDVQLKKSSGYKILDDAALDHTRKHLHLRNAPGEVRIHTLDIVFRLR